MKTLGRILWAVEESANIEHEEENDYLFEYVTPFSNYSNWAPTDADDWCGEFLKRE
jgi:hypothetical protein